MGKFCVRFLNSVVIVLKLELVVVILVIWINKVVIKELEGRFMIDSVIYWIDLMIVLKYIVNEK